MASGSRSLINTCISSIQTSAMLVLGNAGTIISFRIGPTTRPFWRGSFQPKFGVEDLINLANRDIYLK